MMLYRPIMTKDEFIAMNGGDPNVDHGMLRYPHGISKAEHRRNEKRMDIQFGTLHDLRAVYAQMLGMGYFREPTDAERLVTTARGHPDNQSVQAARRICTKRGVVWTDPKWEYLENQPVHVSG
jgi:hypothetical protein